MVVSGLLEHSFRLSIAGQSHGKAGKQRWRVSSFRKLTIRIWTLGRLNEACDSRFGQNPAFPLSEPGDLHLWNILELTGLVQHADRPIRRLIGPLDYQGQSTEACFRMDATAQVFPSETKPWTHFLLLWPTYRTAAMMKAMTATPPMVPTITAIMYFSEEEEENGEESRTLNRQRKGPGPVLEGCFETYSPAAVPAESCWSRTCCSCCSGR